MLSVAAAVDTATPTAVPSVPVRTVRRDSGFFVTSSKSVISELTS
jgi:hypothetical protein